MTHYQSILHISNKKLVTNLEKIVYKGLNGCLGIGELSSDAYRFKFIIKTNGKLHMILLKIGKIF